MVRPIRLLAVGDVPAVGRTSEQLVVTELSTFTEALALLGEQSFDCVVSAVELPEQDGVAFLESVRNDHPELPVILVGEVDERVVTQAINAGVTDIREKETPKALLTQQIHRLATAYRERSETTQRKRRFEAIFNNTHTFVGLLEPDGTLLEANETALSFGGIEREAVVGKPVWETYWFQTNDTVRETAPEAVEQARDGRLYRDEIRVQGVDSEAIIDFSVRPVTDESGEVVLLVPEGRDITTRKRYTRQLETLIDNVPGMVYRCKNERGWPMERVRGETEQLTGYTAETLERESGLYGNELIHPDDRESVWKAVQTTLQQDESFEVTYRLRRKDGEIRWVWERGQGVRTTDDGVAVMEGFITDITAQQRMTEQLREEREFIEQTIDTLDDLFYVVGTDGELRRWNSRLPELTGYTDDEIGEMNAVEFFPPEEQSRITDAISEVLETGEAIIESELRTSDGELVPYEFTESRLTDTAGNLVGLVGIARNITQRKQRFERFVALNDILAAFMNAEDTETVCRITTEAAQSELSLPVTMVALFDDDRGELRAVSQTATAQQLLDEDRLLSQESAAWKTFTTGSVSVIIPDSTTEGADAEMTAQLVIYPLGRHGVLISGIETNGDDIEREFVETVGENLRSALDRVERETLLRERETRLELRNEQLSQIHRINDIIRTLNRNLVTATSREEIERSVCEQLADAGPFVFAWIGTYERKDDRVVSRVRAGNTEGYLDELSMTLTDAADQEPALQAMQREEPVVVTQIRTDPPYEPWREAALKRGYHSAIAVPIIYRDRQYGVLALYAAQTERLDELEQEVLIELGETIAHAINAIDTRRALISNTVVELELSVTVSEIPLLKAIASVSPGTITLETVTPGPEGTYRILFSTTDIPQSELIESVENLPEIRECESITSNGSPARFQCLVGDSNVLTWLLDHGAIPQSVHIEAPTGSLSVHLPKEENIREFVELFQSRYTGTTLHSRRETEQHGHYETVLATLEDRLTPRQQEVLQLAYSCGYFETPRDKTASDLAEVLGIAQPTFTNHLRASQRKLLAVLYDNEGLDR